jgi:aryl-alcohol dehydrogenase-like predicted oxidoreductase
MSSTASSSSSSSPRQMGYGCMGLSAFYSSAFTTTDESAIEVLNYAYDHGCTIFNTATFYGALNEVGFGANLKLLAKWLHQADKEIDRSKIKIMCKVGMDTRCPVEKTGSSWVNRGDADGLRTDIDYALTTLGVDYLDIAVLCRVSPTVPIEESVQALMTAVSEGKAREIGLSEASADTLRRACAVGIIGYLEQEWSLWTRDIEEDIVPFCAANNVTIVAYSPLGRGFLTGTITSRDDKSTLDAKDWRLFGQPRFAAENFDHNLSLLECVKAVATSRSVSLSEVALAWLYHMAAKTGVKVVPIPGTSKVANLQTNIKSCQLNLSEENMADLNKLVEGGVNGDRYQHMNMTFHGNKAGGATAGDH